MKSCTKMKMGHVRSKTRSLRQNLEKPCVRSRGHIVSPIIMKLSQNVFLMKSQTSLTMGHVGSKTRSLSQILEKPCVCSRGHIFSPILMKLGQNVCFDEISEECKIWSCWVENWVTRLNLRKTLCMV